jgi:hypothetical protein
VRFQVKHRFPYLQLGRKLRSFWLSNAPGEPGSSTSEDAGIGLS